MSAGRLGDAGPLAVVGALGVVFGDIGTSPLYALRAVLGEADALDAVTVYGMTSTIIWSLLFVVTGLYVGVLLGRDNDGEGGLLALLALVRRSGPSARTAAVASVLAMVGASMFLGDSVITPAISVLASAEGLEQVSPALDVIVVPGALVILAGIFVLQRVGSGRIGGLYGPVMVVWFAFLAGTGIASIAAGPAVLRALSPSYAVRFFLTEPTTAFVSLGAVILVVTGAEALYADLAHFGRAAITRAWLLVVLPALMLGYLGEAGAVLRDPAAASDPFHALVPGWATVPVLVLAALATIIASEAVIAGAFTVLHQAGGLGLFPYLRTRHPSPGEGGRVYLPAANWTLAVAVLLVVVLFGSSERLALAYGVAVAATFVVTVLLFLTLTRAERSGLAPRHVVGGAALVVVLTLLAATILKLGSGGWLPVVIAVVLTVVMWTWWTGRRCLAAALRSSEGAPEEVLRELGLQGRLSRVPGAAVFLTEDQQIAPFALRTVVDVGGFLPEQLLLLSWQVEDTPAAPAHETDVEFRSFEDLLPGVNAVSVALGYRERLDAEHVLSRVCEQEPDRLAAVDTGAAWFVVSEAIPRLATDARMSRWRQRIFLALDRLATDRVEQLSLPRDRTVVVGRDFDL